MPNHPRVYMDFKFGTRAGGRVVFELYSDTTPRTAENFRALCAGEHPYPGNGGSKKNLHFMDSKVFRVRPGFMCQGGDIQKNNGDGGLSIYDGGQPFRDESFIRRHHAAGCLSMANKGRNSNTSQFFITFKKSPQLDGKHVVFGHVVEGMEVVRAIEKIPTDRNDRPRVDIVVVGCGECATDNQSKVNQGYANSIHRGSMKAGMDELIGETKINSAELAKDVLKGGLALPGVVAEEKPKEPKMDEPASAPFQTERERKLFELKLKMNQGRRMNNSAVVEEKKKEEDPNYKPRHQKIADGEKVKPKNGEEEPEKKATPATNRLAPEGREYLLQTAEISDLREAKRRKKQLNVEGAFGWDAFNTDSLARAHEKRISDIGFHENEYEKQKDSLRESDFYCEGGVPMGHVPSKDAKQRLADALLQAKKKRGEFSRRRTHYEDEDVTYINERNKVFNKKIERVFGEHSLELRQNLERGTAL